MIAYSAQTIASVKNMDVQTLVDAANEHTKLQIGIEFLFYAKGEFRMKQ